MTKRPICSYSNNISYVYWLGEQMLRDFMNGKRQFSDVKEICRIGDIFEHDTKNDLVYASSKDGELIKKYLLRKEKENGEQDNLQTQYGDYSDINRGNDRSAC